MVANQEHVSMMIAVMRVPVLLTVFLMSLLLSVMTIFVSQEILKIMSTMHYPGNPLQNGEQYGLIEKTCCLVPSLPGFNKILTFSLLTT